MKERCTYFANVFGFWKYFISFSLFQIIKRAAGLGVCFGISAITVIYSPYGWKRLGAYFLFMSSFHYSEYLTISFANPHTLGTDTFMLNHSVAYIIAAISSWLEFLVELYLWPTLKENFLILLIGILVCIGGEILRKLAIITANTSFNHVVQYRKSEDHVLITHGVYKWMRHPSYAGWFFWSIGTQIILANPICLVLYAVVSWKFFYERILVEELALINFFLDKYVEYQRATPTGVPFIRGYVEGAYDDLSFK